MSNTVYSHTTNIDIKHVNMMLYAFFWVIPRRLKFIHQRFRTLSVPSSYVNMSINMEKKYIHSLIMML